MTPRDEHGQDYIQIGIAMKNHEDKVLATHYANKDQIDSLDISHAIYHPSPPAPPTPTPDHPHDGHIWLIVGMVILLILLIIGVICFRKYVAKTPEELEDERKLKASEREAMVRGIGDSEISKSGLTSSQTSTVSQEQFQVPVDVE